MLDLTYRQFVKYNDDYLSKLYHKGYQEIDDRMYNYYLTKVTNNKDINITIDDSIFKKTSKFKK